MDIQRLIQELLMQQAQSPQAQQPSRFDFAQAGANSPAPDPALLPSRLDFAENAPQPPPIPQELLNPAPAPTPAPTPTPRPAAPAPAPAPSPQRDQLAQTMAPSMMSQRGGDYTTSGTNPIFAGGSSAVFGKKRKK